MPNGIQLSVREYRELIKEQMPPWMELVDFDLLNYFSLSGHTHIEKMESIIIDDVEYIRNEWTLGELKTELSIAGTGNYDDCTLDILEEIDSDDNVLIYTNPNYQQVDALAVIQKKIDDRRDVIVTQMNPRLATVDGLLSFWEAIFQSERLTIDGQLETDAAYMARVIVGLFSQNSSLVAVRQNFEKYGLNDFQLLNSKEDPTHWNARSAPDSVNLYLDEADYDRIPFLSQIFIDISLAGMRMFVLCPAKDHDLFGLNYGFSSLVNIDYIVPPPFIPGFGLVGEGFGTVFGSFYGHDGPSSNDVSDYVVPPPYIPGFGILGEGFGSLYGAIYGN